MTLPRMRTADQAFEEIKRMDPETAINRNYVRRVVKSGIVPVVHAGRRTLVDLDKLIEAIGRTIPQPAAGIRRIPE